ncbi:MAG: 4Fe-4S dicluster domain-containing protein, partial [Bdellovibrionales bacterium]|nr:4Fe-4S dicluster domain-containing protein [Bdellovibrionales bacterium]
TLELNIAQKIHPDRCGTCARCIDACPTNAIVAPRKLDARRCISYLTIESKTVPEESLRPLIGDNFFGCDICQTVCPWNEKIFGEIVKLEQLPKLNKNLTLTADLRFILSSSNKELERHFKGSPLARARGFGLKRNALIVAANHNLFSLKPEVTKLLTDSRLGELAKWALDSFE